MATNFEHSDYLKQLLVKHPEKGAKYLKKVKPIKCDPFTLKEDSMKYQEEVPDVTLLHYGQYFEFKHDRRKIMGTKSCNAADKEAYKMWKSGCVVKVGVEVILGRFVLMGKVKDFQNKPSVDAWVLLESNSTILTAHCTGSTCLDGLCRHIRAIVYHAIDCSRKDPDLPCSCGATSHPTQSQETELIAFLKKLDAAGLECPVMNKLKLMVPEKNIFDLYKKKFRSMSLQKLIAHANGLTLSMSVEDCAKIEEKTRLQYVEIEIDELFNQRHGRITSSNFKRAAKASIQNPSIALIQQVCYPLESSQDSEASKYNCESSDNAVDKYVDLMEEEHDEFASRDCGLFISPKYPHFSATPNKLVSCRCCGLGCLEVKCPYTLAFGKTLSDYANEKYSCLLPDDKNGFKLKREHSYYYQCQMHLVLTGMQYVDFVLWSPSEIFKERIVKDELFWSVNSEKASRFHKSVILPELLGKYFTKKNDGDLVWCSCAQHTNKDYILYDTTMHPSEYDERMVECQNDECPIKWYHLRCMGRPGVARTPETFTCDTCKALV